MDGGVGECGDGDDGADEPVLSQGAGGVEAIHDGHIDVHQDEVEG